MPPTFAQLGAEATRSLLGLLAPGAHAWRLCTGASCGSSDSDWGADSLTYVLSLRERTAGTPSLVRALAALGNDAPTYPPPCTRRSCSSWSDVPEWDAIALAREYESTRDPRFLQKAEAAFAFVQDSPVFAQGACPEIPYQQPYGGSNNLKTLETDGNAVKAGLLLYAATGRSSFLASALQRYAAIRRFFLDGSLPLYTAYLFDDGGACTQLPRRFFASVNGDMIWNGVELFRDTGDRR